MGETKTIFVDLGGVLIDNPASSLVDFSASKLHVSPSVLKPSLEKYLPEWQKGKCTESEFWGHVTSDYGAPQNITESIWTPALQSCYKEKADVFREIQRHKQAGYQLALLSNTESPVAAYIRTSPSYQLFNTLIMSCEIGLIKPNRDIFEYALHAMNTTPQESIFIDDREENINAANEIGIHGILFTGSVSDILSID
jgi:putative hydrolase of the HAD superfamily